jgi:hypothetical protein
MVVRATLLTPSGALVGANLIALMGAIAIVVGISVGGPRGGCEQRRGGQGRSEDFHVIDLSVSAISERNAGSLEI